MIHVRIDVEVSFLLFDEANENSCSFIEGSCDGVYHYSEPGCGLDGCITHESFWFSFGSFVDLFTEDYCNDVSGEWVSCTHDQFMSEPKTRKMRELLSTPGLPSVKPDGTYNPSNVPTPPEGKKYMNLYGSLEEMAKRNFRNFPNFDYKCVSD